MIILMSVPRKEDQMMKLFKLAVFLRDRRHCFEGWEWEGKDSLQCIERIRIFLCSLYLQCSARVIVAPDAFFYESLVYHLV